jgi:hypothetical protein
MENQQRAKKKPRLTLREQYRQLAIRLLKKERTKILDIQTLQELIEMELDRSIKTDELIAAFNRKDCGLEVTTQEKITWVIFHKPANTEERKMPKPEKSKAKSKKNPPAEFTRLTPAKFTLKAIQTLRKPPHKGIHSVFSGFNAAFREYFPDLDPVQTVIELAEKEIIVSRRTRGGALLYIPEETPVQENNTATDVLKKMGLA